jgi:hypothetical protein
MNRFFLLAEVLIGFLLSYWIITTFFAGNTQFENLALGTETVTYQATDENKNPIHIQKVNTGEQTLLIDGWKKRGKKPVILFFGNSQTHSINQRKDNEVNFVELLYKRNGNAGQDILCHSIPNASLQDFYLAYAYWKTIFPIKTVIIPVFMDDMREGGIRDVFFFGIFEINLQNEVNKLLLT